MVLNIQTERIENHNARFTVTLEPSQLEKAKQQSARKLSQRYNIPASAREKRHIALFSVSLANLLF